MNSDEQVRDLDARIRAVEDELAVLRTITRYGLVVDTREASLTGDLFTEDGVYDADAYAVMRGRNAIEEMASDPRMPSSAHCIGPSVVAVDGDSATASGYSMTYRPQDGGVQLFRLSFNRWELVRVDGASWRVARRVTRLVGSEEAERLFRQSLPGALGNAEPVLSPE